jgi:hypothetical protein
MTWELGKGGEKCGGVKLVSFKGRPKERSLRAGWNILLGSVHFHLEAFVRSIHVFAMHQLSGTL